MSEKTWDEMIEDSKRRLRNLPAEIEARLIEENMSKAEFARLVGVKRWAVGSWIRRERPISEPNQRRIIFLMNLPDLKSMTVKWSKYDTLANEIRTAGVDELEFAEKAVAKINTAYSSLVRTVRRELEEDSKNG